MIWDVKFRIMVLFCFIGNSAYFMMPKAIPFRLTHDAAMPGPEQENLTLLRVLLSLPVTGSRCCV